MQHDLMYYSFLSRVKATIKVNRSSLEQIYSTRLDQMYMVQGGLEPVHFSQNLCVIVSESLLRIYTGYDTYVMCACIVSNILLNSHHFPFQEPLLGLVKQLQFQFSLLLQIRWQYLNEQNETITHALEINQMYKSKKALIVTL